MAGSVTVTYAAKNVGSRKIKIVTVAWVADASAATVPDTTLVNLNGYLVKVITNPGAVAPTDNYDIKLLDAEDNTIDAVNDVIKDRDTANTELALPAVPPLLAGDYTFNLTGNAVNSATGTCILFIDER